MSTKIILGAISVAVIAGIFIFFEMKIKAITKKWENDRKRTKAKDELKEKMETGDSSSDFDASVNILHDLANGDDWGKRYS